MISLGGYIIVGSLAEVRRASSRVRIADNSADPEEATLRREIQSTRELHQTEPDQKCKSTRSESSFGC
jgi:hypothetical protein